MVVKQYAAHQLDFYKTGHAAQYPKGTESVYANFTMRSGNHSNVPNSKGGYIGGMQLFYKAILQDLWNDTFFNVRKDKAVGRFIHRIAAGYWCGKHCYRSWGKQPGYWTNRGCSWNVTS